MLSLIMIGTGYVGLVSGACLASLGHQVTCIDIDADKIAKLKNGHCPLHEDGLPELLKSVTASGNLTFSTEVPDLKNVDAAFLGVGTPQDANGHANMTYLDAAFASLLPKLGPKTVVVTKSTVPVGTCARLKNWMAQARPDLEGHLASNPEFLREGTAVKDFLNPDRIVSGATTDHAQYILATIYGPLVAKGHPHLHTEPASAELSKYAANAFLATKISFINEIAALCEQTGANIGDVATAMGMDARIGKQFLKAGPGYGGSCFPKDTSALVHIAQDAQSSTRITQAAIDANKDAQTRMITQIEALCGGSVANKTIACLGLAFKSGTDDMRDSPALAILPSLLEKGAIIQGTDIAAINNAKPILPISYHDTWQETVKGADVIVLMTEWPDYMNIKAEDLYALAPKAAIADLRRGWNTQSLAKAGFARIYRTGERPFYLG